jgi:single-strand DNA-binding protein
MIDLKMPDINNIIIAGNLTCDPSFRKTTNGTPVANFYIAANRKFKDNNGQWRENVCYVGVVAWYKLAESCSESIRKGSAVLIDGELQNRIWRNEDGTTRNVVEIKARRIQFLNRRVSTEEEELEKPKVEEIKSEFTLDQKDQTEKVEDVIASSEVEEQVDVSDFDFGYKSLEF